MVRNILLDCDPGIDDVLAILFALNEPEINLLGISIVAGNARVDDGVRNALSVLELIDREDIPVVQGASQPFSGRLITAALVHGENGLADIQLPRPRMSPVSMSSSDFLNKKLNEFSGDVDLVATGPLTNVARLLRKHPDSLRHVNRLIIMGGAIDVPGNVTPFAEYNIFADVVAADACIRAEVPTILVPLDVTTSFLFTSKDLREVLDRKTKINNFIERLIKFYIGFERRFYHLDGCFLHDPLAIAAASDVSLFETKAERLHVNTGFPLTRGALFRRKSVVKTINTCFRVKKDVFLKHFKKSLMNY